MLTDPDLVGCYVALTPTWNETAYYADYVLPMGVGSERHDLHSYETHDAQWLGFRQPVMKAMRQRNGETIDDTREVNPGEVWEENEFWLELTWRIDPDGSLGIRQYAESKKNPGTRLSVDEYYDWIFDHSVPGLPEKAAHENLTPLEFMRRYGAFEIKNKIGAIYDQLVGSEELDDLNEDELGRIFTRAPKPAGPNIVPVPLPDGDADGRRLVGVNINGQIKRGFPTPSGKLEFFSTTLADWGPGQSRRRSNDPDFHVSFARADPHAQRKLKMARRNRAHEPALDPPEARKRTWCSHRRSPARRNRNRLLRRAGVGNRRNTSGDRGVQSSHGPLETD
jgi:anaerobic selenocysteine-containing dehydrogenase